MGFLSIKHLARGLALTLPGALYGWPGLIFFFLATVNEVDGIIVPVLEMK